MHSPVQEFLEGRLNETELFSRVENICVRGSAHEQRSLVQSVARFGPSLPPDTFTKINETIFRTKSLPGQHADA